MATAKRRMVLPLTLAVGAMGLMVMTSIAGASHPRPMGATPLRVPLVPAFDECATTNRTHGPPLAFPSCNPPVPSSKFVTVGTPDANGAPAKSQGFVKVAVRTNPGPPPQSTIVITSRITDVRCRAGTSTCGNANTAGGADYTGELQANATIRNTDHYNATSPGGGTDPGHGGGHPVSPAHTVRQHLRPVGGRPLRSCLLTATADTHTQRHLVQRKARRDRDDAVGGLRRWLRRPRFHHAQQHFHETGGLRSMSREEAPMADPGSRRCGDHGGGRDGRRHSPAPGRRNSDSCVTRPGV